MELLVFAYFIAHTLLIYRAFDFVRAAVRMHRERLIQRGFREKNAAHRLRCQKYSRMAFGAYVVVCTLLLLLAPTRHFAHMPMALMLKLALIEVSVVAYGCMLPALFLGWVFRGYGELVHPQGEVALGMRDRQFVNPVEPLQPNGEHGTGQKVSPWSILTNPLAWVLTQEQPVAEEAK